jgi:hypothetical protein
MKRVISNPTQVWGREKQDPKNEHHSNLILFKKNNERPFQLSKRSAPPAVEDASTPKQDL